MSREVREMPRTFGQKLYYFRSRKGYSLQQLANLAKMDAGYIHKLENGERRCPTYPVLKSLSKSLGVHISDLVDIEYEEDEMPIKSIQELLVFSEYLINGELPSLDTREKFLAVIQTMLDCEWDESHKHIESVDLYGKIDGFLRAIK